MLHDTPMTPLLVGVVDALDQRNWPAALHLALAMPAMCANLDPSYGSGPAGGYAGWFDRFVLGHLRDEAVPADGTDGAPPRRRDLPEFTGSACYALRCACLGGEGAVVALGHGASAAPDSGEAAAGVARAFALCYPPASDASAAASILVTWWAGPGGDEPTSSVDAYLLCMCIAKGVLSWLRDVDDDPDVARRLSGMIRVESTGATARRLRQERQTR